MLYQKAGFKLTEEKTGCESAPRQKSSGGTCSSKRRQRNKAHLSSDPCELLACRKCDARRRNTWLKPRLIEPAIARGLPKIPVGISRVPISGKNLSEHRAHLIPLIAQGGTHGILTLEVKDYENEIIKIRRQIHANPELTYKEFETANLVAEKLRSLGISVKTGMAGTGVVGL